MKRHENPLTIALPKGRLEEQVREHLASRGIRFEFTDRKLVADDESGRFRFLLVKNADLPVYVAHGIAGLGVCGEDVVYESGHRFFRIERFSFGGTKMCLATHADFDPDGARHMTIATKFTRFARDHFHKRGVAVEIIKLNGSVELAPVLGLAPYIVDLVETGSTLRANNLVVREELASISVSMIANPAYYKIHYARIDELAALIHE